MENKYLAYIGNWGMKPGSGDYGITACVYDPADGSLTATGSVLPEVHVGNVYIDQERKILYCVDEQMKHEDFHGLGGGGKLFAVKIENDGNLREINHTYSFAPLPSYVTIDSRRKYALLTNHSGGDPITVAEKDAEGNFHPVLHYSDASLVLYRLNEDGSVGPAIDIFKATGHGILPKQSMPHLHSVSESAEMKLFFVCDKGCNKVYSFKIQNDQLIKCDEYADQEGSAPRYGLVLEKQNLFLYNHEASTEVTILRFDENGSLSFVESVPLLPENSSDEKKESSDIKRSPDGKTFYNIIRGINIISVIRQNPQTNSFQVSQLVHFNATTFPGGGARGCAVSPDGKYLYVCVADDGDIHCFPINDDGTLRDEDHIQHMGHPANITFCAENIQ